MRNLHAIELSGQHVQAILDEFNERRTEWPNFDPEDIASVSVRNADAELQAKLPEARVVVTFFFWRDEDG